VPSRYYYYRNQAPGDTSKVKQWIKKNIAEEPAIYYDQDARVTASHIQQYLNNKKGYYDATVTYETRVSNHYANVEYIIDLGKAYRTKSMIYIGDDDEVIRLLAATKAETQIEAGDPLDAIDFDIERQRIIRILQNNGYADFNNNYIKIKGDSTLFGRQVEVFVEIDNPQGSSKHQKYTVGNINVYTDFDQSNLSYGDALDSLQTDDLTFYRNTPSFLVRPEIIQRNIYFKSGNLYSREEYDQTLKALGTLSTYKFVKINQVVSEEGTNVIDYNIFLTPHTHKWTADVGNDVYYSTVNTVSRNQLGLSLNGNLLGRNFLGGAETYKVNADAGWEFQLGVPLRTTAITLGLQNSLTIPRLVDVTRTFKVLRGLRLLSESGYRNVVRNANTSLSLGLGLQILVNNFDVTSITGSYGFDIETQNRKIIFKQFGVGLFLYDLDPRFRMLIEDNQFILNSLSDNFFTGILFNEVNVVWKKPKNSFGVSTRISAGFETSGLEIALANKLIRPSAPWIVNGSDSNPNNDVDFANFFKGSFDYRWYRQLNNENVIAFRSFVGVAAPYFNDQSVPFIKQFFVGGPNSLRAWQPRQLGPGAYSEPNPNTDFAFFQTGDIKLEFNLEYRFDLFYVFEGALFVDAGNVWTLLEDEDRPGSQFGPDFITQIAFGAGYGIRADFNYFIIRFDFGYKVLNSTEDAAGSRFLDVPDQGLGNFNVAINYPF
jgi:outer membrane protein assembly factor BamA